MSTCPRCGGTLHPYLETKNFVVCHDCNAVYEVQLIPAHESSKRPRVRTKFTQCKYCKRLNKNTNECAFETVCQYDPVQTSHYIPDMDS